MERKPLVQRNASWKTDLVLRGQRDPVWWISNILGDRLWNKQQEICQAIVNHERVAVPASYGVGKTHISARIALWFLCNFKPAKVISTAPTLRQVRDLLWKELRTAHQKALMPLGGQLLQLSLTFNDEHFAVGFSTDETSIEKFTGFHSPNQLVIFDQAAGIQPAIWEAAEGLMTSANCRWLVISNTAIADCELANICMPEKKSRFGKWKVIKITAEESPNVVAGRNIYPGLVSYDWVKKRREAWGEDDPLYKIFVKAEFVPSSQMSVVPYRFVMAAFENEGELGTSLEIGLDVARMGLDSTVWTIKSGSRVLEIRRVTGNDTMEVAGLTVEVVRECTEKYEMPVSAVKIDVVGLGAGVYDRLVEIQGEDDSIEIPVIAVNNAEQTTVIDKDRYLNIRAELSWEFRKRMSAMGVGLKNVIISDYEILDHLRQELTIMRYKISSNGKIQIVSKDDLRKDIGRSPDYYDSLVLAFEQPGGGPPAVEYLLGAEKVKKEETVLTDEEWNVFIGLSVPIEDKSFKEIRVSSSHF